MPQQKVKTAMSDAIVQWIAYLHNSYPIVGALLVLMLLDVMVGLAAAFVTKSVSSTVSYKGMVRKVIMLLLVAVASVLDPYAGDIPVSKLTAMFFIATEGISILENAKRAGVPIPDWLGEVLAKLKNGDKPSYTNDHPMVEIQKADSVTIQQDQRNDGT